MALPEIYPCELCGKIIHWNEFIINFGICDDCFNTSYEQYMEEMAGPFDYLLVNERG